MKDSDVKEYGEQLRSVLEQAYARAVRLRPDFGDLTRANLPGADRKGMPVSALQMRTAARAKLDELREALIRVYVEMGIPRRIAKGIVRAKFLRDYSLSSNSGYMPICRS